MTLNLDLGRQGRAHVMSRPANPILRKKLRIFKLIYVFS
jgi:hypothetical protein